MDRVRYFAPPDWAIPNQLSLSQKVILEFDKNRTSYSVNDIIEYSNIIKYFRDGIRLESWSEIEISSYAHTVEEFKPLIGKFINQIAAENFKETFNQTIPVYREDLLRLIEANEVFKRVPWEEFSGAFEQKHLLIRQIVQYKKIVKYYDNDIKDLMLEEPISAEIILDKKLPSRGLFKRETYLPEFRKSEVESIIKKYILFPDAAGGYLRLIAQGSGVEVSDRTKLDAKIRLDNDTETFFKNEPGIGISVSVVFQEQQKKVEMEGEGFNLRYSYSIENIENNLDYRSLLNNLISLFLFIDDQARITLVHKESELSVFERLLLLSSPRQYPTGIGFMVKEMSANGQFMAYRSVLETLGVHFEDAISWVFSEYFKTEFQIQNFQITMPTKESSYLEKCRMIFAEMEFMLKQFNIFVSEGNIDHSLLQISSGSQKIENIPSLVDRKYFYSIEGDYGILSHLLFSDQSSLAYIEKIVREYSSFYELLRNEKIGMKDLDIQQKNDIDWLLRREYVGLDESDYFVFNKPLEIEILKDVYENGVIGYHYLSKATRSAVDDLERKKILESDSTLFSRSESDYFNYYLNKSRYDNGPDLRNSYTHGTQTGDNLSGKEHEENYSIILKIFTLMLIKINEDLRIWDETK